MIVQLLLLVVLGLAGGDEWEQLAEAGRWPEIRELAEQRLHADPGDVAAHHWLGRELLEEAWGLLEGDRLARDLGRSVLARAIDQLQLGATDDIDGEWLLRARYTWFELHEGNTELSGDSQLVADLERAWEHDGLAVAAFLRGWAARLAGEPSLVWFERAARAAPVRAAHALAWAEALVDAGDKDAAAQAWLASLEDPEADLATQLASLASLFPAISDAPRRLSLIAALGQDDEALVAWYRAHAAGQTGHPEDAVAAFAAAQKGRTPAIDRAHAGLLVSRGDVDAAVALLMPLVRERDWDALDQLVGVADGLAMERRFDKALTIYADALAVEPRHERALRHRAIALWQAGRRGEAAEAWAAIVERSPGRSDLLNDAALAAWGAGDLPLARQRLEQAIAMPGSVDAHENLAVLLLTVQPADAGAALSLLDQVLQQEPDRDRALLNRYRARRSH